MVTNSNLVVSVFIIKRGSLLRLTFLVSRFLSFFRVIVLGNWVEEAREVHKVVKGHDLGR